VGDNYVITIVVLSIINNTAESCVYISKIT